MGTFLNTITANIGLNDIIDIFVVTFVIYKILGFIKQSRAEQLVKGLLIILIVTALSDILKLHTLNWILRSSMAVGVIALVIVFQPELRRGLESLGRSKVISKGKLLQIDKGRAEKVVEEIMQAVESMSSARTGALIVIERETALNDICESGIRVDGKISAELITNIFYEGAPLHDGAIILRGERVHSAGCVLPLTQNRNLPSELGTRHRAGIGITEHSDSVSIIVSEETGIVSIAIDGKLIRKLKGEKLKKFLVSNYISREDVNFIDGMKLKIKEIGGFKDASK